MSLRLQDQFNKARSEVRGRFRQFVESVESRWQDASQIKAAASTANELLIYGSIGYSWYEDDDSAITGKNVRAWLAERSGQDVTIRINSPGGDVFEGVAIHNALAQHEGKVTVHIDALAASAASVIAMAGDEIHIAANAMVMIHRAWTWTAGNANDLEKEAALLRQIDGTLVATYVARTSQETADIEAMLDAETWLTAEDAKAKGFADTITPAKTPPAPAPEPEGGQGRAAQLRKEFAANLERFKALTGRATGTQTKTP